MPDGSETLRALGLIKNPFATPSEDLFGGGDRMRQLDELRHLSRWSRRLLVVTGDRGVGKSTMYRALASRLDPGVKAARINANLANESRELLTSIVQGFGIATPSKATPDLLVDLISVHVAEQAAAERACVVLVDDAHLVELRALDQLLRLTEAGGDQGLRIVFFAEAYFVRMLDRAVSRLEKPLAWHEIRLAAFSPEEVRQYLKFRFEGSGYEGRLPFADAEVDAIVSASAGLPGKVDDIAGAMLQGDLTAREAIGWLPPWHRAFAALLVVAIGIAWLLWDRKGADERVTATSPAVAASTPSAANAPERVDDATIAQPVSVPLATTPPPEVQAPTTQAPTPAEGATEAGPATAGADAEPEPPAAAEENEAPAARTPAPAPMPPPVVVEAKPKPRPVPTPEPDSFDLGWIDGQADDRFTLQLLGTSSRARVDEYLARQAKGTPIVAYASERNGSPWYIVIYGSYESAAAATAASKRLPASVGKVTPWVRRFGAIRPDIKR